MIKNIFTIFQKEVNSFFNSLIAYIVIVVFLAGVGIFFWVFEANVLETGAAEMDTLFFLGPWFYLFLIPAITMRMFSEEYKTGTIEFLLTKPISELQIVLGKFFAAVFLVFFSLLPTVIYYITIYRIGDPVGSIDSGATLGSYLGLFALGMIFAAIGIFASSLTDNQIVSFILAAFFSFFFYSAFDYIAELKVFQSVNEFVLKLGVSEHYRSISRGVVDSRDVLYFVTIISVMLLGSKLALSNRKSA